MTSTIKPPFKILIADDDTEDILLTKECFTDNHLPVEVHEVHDGQILMDYLHTTTSSLPHLLLLDLNMPRKSGLEALEEIKAHISLRKIPVVIFTTSTAPRDIAKAYELGASCFITKPNNMEEWCDKIDKIGKFWVECVQVPR